MVGWHHQLDGLEFEQDPNVSDRQGSLPYCIVQWVAKSRTQLSDFNFQLSIKEKKECFERIRQDY